MEYVGGQSQGDFIVVRIALFSDSAAILYLKAASQARSEAIEQGMHLEFSNEGIDARQGDQEIHYTWDNVYKSMIKRDLLIIYFDHVRAYLVPKRYWQKDREKLLTIIRANTRVRNF